MCWLGTWLHVCSEPPPQSTQLCEVDTWENGHITGYRYVVLALFGKILLRRVYIIDIVTVL